jgi:cephalosporin hydroxylase
MDPNEEFRQYVARNIKGIGEDRDFLGLSNIWNREAIHHRYALNFSWLGRPIVQVPQDTYAIQELIWACRPDLIVETGIAHGGSLVMSASMLAMLDYCDAVQAGQILDPKAGRRKVVGVDIDIRAHNRSAIDAHPLRHKITMIEGSSVADDVFAQVRKAAEGYERVMVFLDSNHTHEHVLAELELYAPLTSKGSYCVVWDTGVEDLQDFMCADRPWGKGNNPKTAAWAYLKALEDEGRTGRDGQPLSFAIDKTLEHKLAITASPDGFLKRV